MSSYQLRPEGAAGPQALLLGVVAMAARDALSRRGDPVVREDARHYFASRDYERHLQALELPAGTLPVAITEAAE